MTQLREVRCTLVAALIISLAACGGGGASPTAGVGIGGTGKPGLRFGDVETAGGLRIAGLPFSASTATVRIGGALASAADLRDGHVALAAGTIADAGGVADLITVDEVVKGELTARLGPSLFRVQGQAVEIDERTVFGPGIASPGADDLAIGDLLEIWGYVRGPGLIRATRIEREDSLSEIRLVGIVEAASAAGRVFSLGMQGIDYATADVSQLPAPDPADGDLVRVRGSAVLDGDGEVVALRIDPYGLAEQEDNDDTEIEGYVTAIMPGFGFSIGNEIVQTNATTRYVGGTAVEIVVGLEVEAEGAVVGGMLIAREVTFKEGVELESDVASIMGSTLTLVGLPGLTVRVDDLTEYDGAATGFGSIQVGDHVQIRGRAAGVGLVAAVEIDERSPDVDISIQGPVDGMPAPADPFLSILGVTIDTSGIPDGEFEDGDGVGVGRAGFFALLRSGVIVNIDGEIVAGVPAWDNAELEGEDD